MTTNERKGLEESLSEAASIQECLDIADTDWYFAGIGPDAINKALSLVTCEAEAWTVYKHTRMNSEESHACIQKAKAFQGTGKNFSTKRKQKMTILAKELRKLRKEGEKERKEQEALRNEKRKQQVSQGIETIVEFFFSSQARLLKDTAMSGEEFYDLPLAVAESWDKKIVEEEVSESEPILRLRQFCTENGLWFSIKIKKEIPSGRVCVFYAQISGWCS